MMHGQSSTTRSWRRFWKGRALAPYQASYRLDGFLGLAPLSHQPTHKRLDCGDTPHPGGAAPLHPLPTRLKGSQAFSSHPAIKLAR
jgi:hypothetical protein